MRKSISSFTSVAAISLAATLVSVPFQLGVTTAQAKNYIKINESGVGVNKRIKVGLNKSLVIDLPADAHDILVANPEVADAVTRTSRRIYIFAKQVGETNIFIFDAAGRQLLSIDLDIERDTFGLEKNLKKYIPGSNIKVEIVNDNIMLTGSVPTPGASARAVQLANIFLSGGEATTNQFSNNGSTGGNSGGTTIVFGDDENRQASQIVNLLTIDGEDQVHLKVTVAEVQRTVAKQLGIDLSATGFQFGNLSLDAAIGSIAGLGNLFSTSRAQVGYSNGTESITSVIRAMNQAGVMRTLAEPTLTAISGEAATFRVGGQYHLPSGVTSDDEGGRLITTERLDYGVSLQFRPVVLGPGRISLRIRTEVSEPTSQGSAQFLGVSLPGLRQREAETTIEVPSGGSMVIAGLLQDDVRQVSSGFPGLKNIPILGTLFRSREYQRVESELIIIATPYLVRPVARQKLARPDDNLFPAGDGAASFMGKLNKVYGATEGGTTKKRYHGNVGFIFK